jgi:hypothetical protein
MGRLKTGNVVGRLEELSMAIDEPDSHPRPYQGHSSPLMQFESSALFAMLLQIGAGVMTLLTFGPSILIVLPMLSAVSGGPVNPIGIYSLIALVPLSLVQIYFGYRLYKRIPSTVTISIISDLLAFALYLANLVSSIVTDTLSSLPQMYIGFIGINLAAVILLLTPSSRSTFEGSKWVQ